MTILMLLAIDGSPPSTNLQRAILSQLVRPSSGQPFDFENSSFAPTAPDADPLDECKWQGVECTHGAITTLFFNRYLLEGAGADICWLPPTLEYFHASHLLLASRWKAVDLPRALKYLHMRQVYLEMNNAIVQREEQANDQGHPEFFIDLRKLPQRIEELFLHGAWLAGPIHLTHLPRSMRVVHISEILAHRTYVDYAKLPEGLVSAHVHYREGSVSRQSKLVSVSEERPDTRVKLCVLERKDILLRSAYAPELLKKEGWLLHLLVR